MEKINNTKEKSLSYIRKRIRTKPEIAVILGSGLGRLAEEIKSPVMLDYGKIPGFPVSTVPGHKGRLIFGKLEGKNVVAMQGRFHYYEGLDMSKVTYPIEIFHELGVETLIVTNAGGAVKRSFSPGDIVLICDHINFSGVNPLRGAADFIDLTFAYDPGLGNLAVKTAGKLGIPLKKGVYLFLSGPSYETPAEIRMFRRLGADMVGMSTVPEVIKAARLGMRVLGISVATNMAAGILNRPLSHKEVLETTEKAGKRFVPLVKNIVKNIERRNK
ncbi:MAG TPA: purine-nucleoside phosphorylase [bacterium]|nr:purine-nucleoside phosphorylase [bacterium]